MADLSRTLLIGIGNSGRADDGLGWAFLDEVEKTLPKNYDLEYRYQLQVEDAELISHYNTVFFIDAHKKKLVNGYLIEKCLAVETHHFTTHELPPETVLYLTNQMYKKYPKAFVLGITGVAFELKIGLSAEAKKNLSQAVKGFCESIKVTNSLYT